MSILFDHSIEDNVHEIEFYGELIRVLYDISVTSANDILSMYGLDVIKYVSHICSRKDYHAQVAGIEEIKCYRLQLDFSVEGELSFVWHDLEERHERED